MFSIIYFLKRGKCKCHRINENVLFVLDESLTSFFSIVFSSSAATELYFFKASQYF